MPRGTALLVLLTLLGAFALRSPGAIRAQRPPDPGQPQMLREARAEPGRVDGATAPLGQPAGSQEVTGRRSIVTAAPPPPSGRETVSPAPVAPAAAAMDLGQSIQFDGLSEAQTFKGTPDTGIAVGPSHIVETVNAAWAAYDRQGNVVRSRTFFTSWFAGQGLSTDHFFNPRVLYRDGRFYMIVLWLDRANARSVIAVSVSQTASASGAWCNYTFNGMVGAGRSGGYADFTQAGITTSALLIGTDHYALDGGGFALAMITAIPRAGLDRCGTATARQFTSFTNQDTGPAVALLPVDDYDTDTGAWVINSWAPFKSWADRVSLWRLDDPFGNATWTRYTVATKGYATPPDAPQPNGRGNLDTIDPAMLSAVRRNGTLWAAHASGVDAGCGGTWVAGIHWMALTVTVGAPQLQHDGFLAGGCDEGLFFPALGVAGNGSIALLYNRSGTRIFPEIRVTGRSVDDPPGTFAPSQLVISSSPYTENSGRWGVYNAATADPSDAAKVWLAGQYLKADNSWGTRIVQVDTGGDGGGGGAVAPAVTQQPASATVAAGQTATFSVSASGTAPLAYQWQRNGASIGGATGSSYTTPPVSSADNGATYRVMVTNSAGSVTSSAATLTVGAGAPPAGTIYADGLAAEWVNWSWSSTVNLESSASVYSGNRAISLSINSAWGALYLRRASAMSVSGLGALRFAVRATQSGQRLTVALRDENDAVIRHVRLSDHGGDPPAGAWRLYTIPLADLGVTGPIRGFQLQDVTGAAQAPLSVDAVEMIAGGAPSGAFDIYTDSRAAGWVDWSWGGAAGFASTSPVYSGSASIRFDATSAWGGLFLHSDLGVSTAGYTTLRFAARAQASGQMYYLQLRGPGNQTLGQPVALSTLGGDPPVGAWRLYQVPLSSLGAANVTITGIVIQAGAATPSTVYVDAIALVGGP